MKLFEKFNRLQSGLLIPFVFASILIVATEIFNLISPIVNDYFAAGIHSFTDLFSNLIVYIFCYFLTVYLTDGKKWLKGFWCVICFAFFQTAFYAVYDVGIYYLAGLLISVFISFLFNRYGISISMAVSIIFSITFGIVSGYVFEYFENFLMTVSLAVSGKGVFSSALFSAIDSIFTLLGVDNFRDLFFYKSYGGSQLIDGNIVTGIKDLFNSGYNGDLVSAFLSGHYYLLFGVSGICVSMMSKLKNAQKTVLIIMTVSSVISGDLTYLFLFILLESPFLFLSVIFISVLSFVSAYLLKLSIGYVFNGGIIEMIINSDNYVYLLAGGVVFFTIGYFLFKFSNEKHGISDCINIYIPTRLSSTVEALGGIENLIRFNGNKLEVRNPKLINTVKIDCEINENIVESNNEKFIELKEYLI